MVDTLVLGTSALRVRVRVPPSVHYEGEKSKILDEGVAVTVCYRRVVYDIRVALKNMVR